MNKKIAILSILIAGGISSAYAVSNGSITTGDLTVTGICTGCGASEGSYTTYNTIFQNMTITPSNGGLFAQAFYLSNTGAATVNTASTVYIVTSTGSILDQGATYSQSATQVPTVQSITGIYKASIISNSSGQIVIIKNNSLLSTLSPDLSQFFGGSLATAALAISPDGKYIGILSKDAGGTSDRLVIYEGS